MDSPLVSVILATLGGYLIILFCISAYDWILWEFPIRPDEPPIANRIQHPIHHQTAVKAIEWFSRLPKAEQTAMKESLKANLVALEQWITRLDQSNWQILCMGEYHEESTRNFLAETIFTEVRADALLLETTPGCLKRLIDRMEAGRDYFPLLDADIMRTLRAAIERDPNIQIRGIEETDFQQKHQGGPAHSRDRHIAYNFWQHYQPGRRHIILFGALHCANESNWLFHILRSQAPSNLKDRMLNVVILGEHQNGPLESFVFFLDEIGIQEKCFVITNTTLLHPHICALFKLFKREFLEKYQAVIVFRPNRQGGHHRRLPDE